MRTYTLLPLLLSSFAGPLLAQSAEVPTVINVEVDYMVDEDHSHQPSQAVIDALVAMFACHGITLNFMLDEAIPHRSVISCIIPNSANFWSCLGFRSFAKMKNAYAQTAGMSGWHYAIIGHDYDAGLGTGSTGRAEGCGGDFIVTLGDNETDFRMAATFAHELGHTLGLGHSTGASSSVSGEYAPNYPSIMSYRYQLGGIKSKMESQGLVGDVHLFKEIDYSNGRLPTLSEFFLEEPVGVGIRSVDWDCDGTIDPGTVGRDLDTKSGWCDPAPLPLSTLVDQDDWAMLCDSTDNPEVYLDLIQHPSETCISVAEFIASEPQGPSESPDFAPPLETESCQAGQMIFVEPGAASPQMGTGDAPYGTLTLAVGAAPAGSVIYLQAGTYTSEILPMVITKRLILAGPGVAVVGP